MIFGILKPNNSITEVEEVFMSVASCHGHISYVFTASDVNFNTNKILGKTLKSGKIVKELFEFPDIIQNRLAVHAEDKETYLKLAEQVPFTNNRIGTKKYVNNILSKIPELQKYLIEVEDCNSVSTLTSFVDKYNKIILKPLSGNQGKGIYTVEKYENKFKLKHLNDAVLLSNEDLIKFFDKAIKAKNYSVSPFFLSETSSGQSTVFRIHMTRGAKGVWRLIKFFPYVNISPTLDITNGMLGALITTREVLFLKQNYPNSSEKIHAEVQNLFKIFSREFQKFYPWRLDGLGLDIGIDQNGNIGIFEINVGAGIGFMAYQVAKNQVQYYEWLKENAKKPYKNNFLPINLRK